MYGTKHSNLFGIFVVPNVWEKPVLLYGLFVVTNVRVKSTTEKSVFCRNKSMRKDSVLCCSLFGPSFFNAQICSKTSCSKDDDFNDSDDKIE
jgi:hypothetical protein